jgi:hypothetical protein
MSRFADVLDRLVTTSGVSKLDWVTIQNEPNTKPAPGTTKAVTPERLADMYQRLHEKLVAKGLRQIRLMGGDLIEGDSHPESPLHHSRWFEFMSKHYADILGAYSAHIYWDYQTPDRFQFRLKDTHDIVAGLTNRKPLYITEYGIRSADRNRLVNGKKPIDPGNFKDGTSLGRTNIAAFQQAWFQIRAAQMGYAGVIKWDGYFGKYDRGTSAYYAIGPPGADGWEPYPMSFLLRLFTTTTETGWRVLSIEQSKSSPATKQLTAFGGPAGELTIIGLDSRGASENKAVKDKISYTIGGLPPHTSFALVLWNRAGGGHVVVDSTITTGAERVKTIEVPLHSVFALTTKTLPPL